MITLAIDASTYRGSVAILGEDRVLVQQSVQMRNRDAEQLMPAVIKALQEAGTAFTDLERVVCGAGPGSFTSLRIAASIAKGVAVGQEIPLFAVSSLALIVAANVTDGPSARRYLACLDALRGDSYVAPFELDAGDVRPAGPPALVKTDDVPRVAQSHDARIVGPEQPDAWHPHARGVALLQGLLRGAAPVDIASWEPEYGRVAEAQARWEAAHGRPLGV